MLGYQRFFKADSRIIFIKVIAILEALCPPSEKLSCGVKIQTCSASCLSSETIKKASSRTVNFVDRKAFISQLGRWKEINSSVADHGYRLPLHHLLALIFYVVMPSKRLGLSVLSYRKSDKTDLSKCLEACFWRHSVD